ncbi:MAG: ABC transporter ATP-binding protein [Gammaproteobacteria bacterium]|nr:ABC transporter ATP-binding protein [Gammaproteobacteria bacterium]
MIDVQDIHFSYPDGLQVLKGLSCSILEGEKVALIGPNGAGKSTFMSHLNGVQLPTSGRISVDGIEISKKSLKDVRRRVGIVFQDPDDQLFCPTVFDDVAFGPLNLGLPRDEIEARVTESLQIVGLEGFEQRSSFHLSFGERKRLALATVLSYRPNVLVFDEPSTNMDPLNRRKLITWLKNSDKTILLCTHDLDIALEVCDRCLVLADGRIIADGPSKDILYDRELLERNKLELPLALMTHELLHGILYASEMDDAHREIISKFLHAHRHAHGPDGHEHVHIHVHPHPHSHMHDRVGEGHSHDLGRDHLHHEGHGNVGVPHTHDDDHDHGADGHRHDHDGPHHHHEGEGSGHNHDDHGHDHTHDHDHEGHRHHDDEPGHDHKHDHGHDK